MPACLVSSSARYAPSTRSSPCTRLISLITPKTSDSPSAVIANRPPSSTPVTSAVASSWPEGRLAAIGMRLIVLRQREQEVARLHRLVRTDDDGLAALPLILDQRQLGGVVRRELDRSRHVRLVRLRDRRVHLRLVGRTGLRDRLEQHLRRRGGVGDVLGRRVAGLLLELLGQVRRTRIVERRIPV